MFITKHCTSPAAKNTALSIETQTQTPVSNNVIKSLLIFKARNFNSVSLHGNDRILVFVGGIFFF